MRLFLVVTIVTILSFDDMLHISFAMEPGVCAEVDGRDIDLSSSFLVRNAIRAYSIFVGDVGLDDYRTILIVT